MSIVPILLSRVFVEKRLESEARLVTMDPNLCLAAALGFIIIPLIITVIAMEYRI